MDVGHRAPGIDEHVAVDVALCASTPARTAQHRDHDDDEQAETQPPTHRPERCHDDIPPSLLTLLENLGRRDDFAPAEVVTE